MHRKASIAVAASVTVGLASCAPPEFPPVERPDVVLVGVTAALGRQAVDSIFWYTGFRPDSLVVADGVLRLAMPAGSVGQELEATAGGCHSPAIPFGVVQRVAQEAWRNAGDSVGADTVVVTVAQLRREVRNRGGHRACAAGPATLRVEPDQLRPQGGSAAAPT